MLTAKPPTGAFILAAWISWSGPAPCPAAPGDEPAPAPAVYGTWQTFTTADGLPHDRVLAVTALGNKVWVGTAGGLAHFEDGSWTSWTEQDGLPAPAISAVALDPRTGDVWLGTWGAGLVRFSGGRFDQFSQLNSGLAGDLVFAAVVAGGRVWAATNGGLSAYDVAGDTWELHLERRLDTGDTAITGLCVDGPRLYAGPRWRRPPAPRFAPTPPWTWRWRRGRCGGRRRTASCGETRPAGGACGAGPTRALAAASSAVSGPQTTGRCAWAPTADWTSWSTGRPEPGSPTAASARAREG
jgi:hypothetical protein